MGNIHVSAAVMGFRKIEVLLTRTEILPDISRIFFSGVLHCFGGVRKENEQDATI